MSRMPGSTMRLAWSRLLRREIQIGLDLLVLALAFALAYLLRFEFSLPRPIIESAMAQAPMVLLIQFLAILVAGIHSYVWRYVGLTEVRGFALAALLSAGPLVVLRLLLPDALAMWRVPLSVIIVDTGIAFSGLLGLRVWRRMVWERHERHAAAPRRRQRRTLLIGAGHAGVVAARELGGLHRELEVVGFLDDAEEKMGAVIHGTRVLGPTSALGELLDQLAIEEVVVTMSQAPSEVLRRVVETCKRAGVPARIIPSLHEILVGRVSVGHLREVQIEDLLGREPVRLDDTAVRELIEDRVVLVTGAGGSIGSELARQVARFAPRRLVLVERAEPALFEVEWELRALFPELELELRVLDCSSPRISEVLARTRPALVLHAAAHKHVPLMESNPVEAAANNVVATHRLALASIGAGVERFVLVSTDKAVRPRSVMGATKRAAEMVVQSLGNGHGTRLMSVRFGNVLGSTGSVIPIFRRQIEAGGPVTVTDPEMERYFMTIPEAAQLVLQAAALGSGGEIFVLDMGQPVRILDLARDMIRLAGLEPDRDIEIAFTGLRPGEKLREELQVDSGSLAPTQVAKIGVATAAPATRETVVRFIAELEAAIAEVDEAGVRVALARAIPEAMLTDEASVATVESASLAS